MTVYDYKGPADVLRSMVGETIESVSGAESGSERIEFVTRSGRRFVMWHTQDCCESVSVESVDGSVEDLIGQRIVLAEIVDSGNRGAIGDYDESFTWTYYTIASTKGTIVIRWYGTSNGYYSESVDVAELES